MLTQQEIEKLPLNERIKLAEKVNFLDAIQPGWLIDAKDSVNSWCVAEVIKKEGNEITINYDGWSSKHDIV